MESRKVVSYRAPERSRNVKVGALKENDRTVAARSSQVTSVTPLSRTCLRAGQYQSALFLFSLLPSSSRYENPCDWKNELFPDQNLDDSDRKQQGEDGIGRSDKYHKLLHLQRVRIRIMGCIFHRLMWYSITVTCRLSRHRILY